MPQIFLHRPLPHTYTGWSRAVPVNVRMGSFYLSSTARILLTAHFFMKLILHALNYKSSTTSIPMWLVERRVITSCIIFFLQLFLLSELWAHIPHLDLVRFFCFGYVLCIDWLRVASWCDLYASFALYILPKSCCGKKTRTNCYSFCLYLITPFNSSNLYIAFCSFNAF